MANGTYNWIYLHTTVFRKGWILNHEGKGQSDCQMRLELLRQRKLGNNANDCLPQKLHDSNLCNVTFPGLIIEMRADGSTVSYVRLSSSVQRCLVDFARTCTSPSLLANQFSFNISGESPVISICRNSLEDFVWTSSSLRQPYLQIVNNQKAVGRWSLAPVFPRA